MTIVKTNKLKYCNCVNCPLYDNNIVKPEVIPPECKNGEQIDVLILGEAPSHEEIRYGRPLIGPAGQIFRRAFHESRLDTLRCIISNVVLCSNIVKNKTVTPPDKAIECCSGFWKYLINRYKPKVVLLLGTIPAIAIGLLEKNKKISEIRGEVFLLDSTTKTKYIATYHPSFILRNGSNLETPPGSFFLSDLCKVYKYATEDVEIRKSIKLVNIRENDAICIDSIKSVVVKDSNNVCYYKIPDKYYSSDYRLIDVQKYSKNKYMYIFRHRSNKKVYLIDDNDEFYYYASKFKVESFEEIDIYQMLASTVNLEPRIGNYYEFVLNEEKAIPKDNDVPYEFTVSSSTKRLIDYNYYKYTRLGLDPEKENDIEIKKLYLDIEVYNDYKLSFPDPILAENPISTISYKVNDDKICVMINLSSSNKKKWDKLEVLSRLKELNKDYIVEFFDNEVELLSEFINRLNYQIVPDIITGWNVIGFDLKYILNRMKKLGFDKRNFTIFDFVSITETASFGVEQRAYISGYCVIDMMWAHKKLMLINEESMALDYVSEKHLGIKKVKYEGTLDKLFDENLFDFLEYSVRDVELIYMLDEYFGYVDLYVELCRICNCNLYYGHSPIKLIDSIMILFAKTKGLACRDSKYMLLNIKSKSDSIIGAYVLHPISGRFKNVVDLDFTSLYPSIIVSFNIGPNTYIAKIDEKYVKKIFYKKEYSPDEYIKIEMFPNNAASVIKEIKISDFIKKMNDKKYIVSPYGTIFVNHSINKSFYSEIIEYFLSKRVYYKSKMLEYRKENNKKMEKVYNNIQYAYKVLANSIYGAMSNEYFRFYNPDLAQTITITGQTIIKLVGYSIDRYMQNEYNFEDALVDFEETYNKIEEEIQIRKERRNILKHIIYQDTDSIFVKV